MSGDDAVRLIKTGAPQINMILIDLNSNDDDLIDKQIAAIDQLQADLYTRRFPIVAVCDGEKQKSRALKVLTFCKT